MFAIYFMLSRNNLGLVIACLLALSTKEEVPIDIIMLALAILVFQRRYKLGLGLIGLEHSLAGHDTGGDASQQSTGAFADRLTL